MVETPYQKIVRAAKAGRSLSLDKDEVKHLSRDHAIYTVAQNDDERDRRIEQAENDPQQKGNRI